MTNKSTILLIISLVTTVAGGILDFTRIKTIPLLAVFLPLGAVFFGMFLISYMMEKEMAKFDEENALKYERIRPNTVGDSDCRSCKNCECQTRKQHQTDPLESNVT